MECRCTAHGADGRRAGLGECVERVLADIVGACAGGPATGYSTVELLGGESRAEGRRRVCELDRVLRGYWDCGEFLPAGGEEVSAGELADMDQVVRERRGVGCGSGA